MESYDILVIGGGAGGLVTAAGSSNMGAHVALIERNFLGGDCLNTGCVPSKAFLKCANTVHAARHAEEFGIIVEGNISVNFPVIMERMRKIRAHIAENDSAKRFADKLGCDLYFGQAVFTGSNTVSVNGKELKFNKAVIATGGRPFVPPIEGLVEDRRVPFYTSDNIFNLRTQPKSMAILGAGPIAAELGQAFQRLGTNVTFVARGQLLGREDSDASALLHDQMVKDGCRFLFDHQIKKVTLARPASHVDEHPLLNLTLQTPNGASDELEVEVLLLATGRQPNVDALALEAANVTFHARDGIYANKYLQTSNPNIYAVGDCLAMGVLGAKPLTPGPGY